MNEKRVWTQGQDLLEAIGIYYDAMETKWGTAADLTKSLFDYKGVTVSRFIDTVMLAYRGTVFATIDLVFHGKSAYITHVIPKHDSPAMKIIPELITEFLNT